MIRLAFLYLAVGVGIVYLQLGHSPCRVPAVLDDGGPPIGPPLDLVRIGMDRDYQWRLGKDVIFWLPRLVDLVGIRGMPFPDFLFGRVCKDEQTPAPPPAGETASTGAVMPPPPAAEPSTPVQPLPTGRSPAAYTPPVINKPAPVAAPPTDDAPPPIPIERPRRH